MSAGLPGDARLRAGDRIWVDLTLSDDEIENNDNAADNNDGQRWQHLPPQVEVNPYAPPNWNLNLPPPRGPLPTRTNPTPSTANGTDSGITTSPRGARAR